MTQFKPHIFFIPKRVCYEIISGPLIGGQDTFSEPAVPFEESIKPDYIVCLEDGRRLKMLKRHLKTAYNMTPDQYRERWNLPANYPMVAPNYAKFRSSIAKNTGLGDRKRRSKKDAA